MLTLGATGWWTFGALAVGYSLRRLCLWFERAGYLYYVNSWRKGSRGSFGLALGSAIDLNARRVLEALSPGGDRTSDRGWHQSDCRMRRLHPLPR